jgi:hypothetical protein
MTNSDCSVARGDQRSLARGADEPVVPDGGGEGEQALGDPDEDAQVGTPAVRLEPALALEGRPIGTGPMGTPEST